MAQDNPNLERSQKRLRLNSLEKRKEGVERRIDGETWKKPENKEED